MDYRLCVVDEPFVIERNNEGEPETIRDPSPRHWTPHPLGVHPLPSVDACRPIPRAPITSPRDLDPFTMITRTVPERGPGSGTSFSDKVG